jgi:hypothetical protein
MNRAKLKNNAPQARRDFIQAMTDRAAFYGLTAKKIEPVVERGDVAVIAGREHPRAVAKKRKQLDDRIKRHGFEQTMEAMAYTWFNRLVAIRFMEVHGYLDHGYRVLSGRPTTDNTDGTDKKSDSSSSVKSVLSVVNLPEILVHAEHVDLPGLKKEAVIDLKLAGNKEAELYRLLLTAQCNALNTAMPFLFEKIDDETELLLPDNLLHSDSLIRKLVGEIDEEDWQQVEIIGWLYQFYISEKKDEVIGKVVASEDIPAATQLFTPNWIVKYLVQNTLGRQWLATYPQSALRQQMKYYIEPAEQTPEVQEQLKAIKPTSLNPEELTLLDPARGSGHILVEAYDLFKAIYQERGYRAKDIPALILQKNLFGLEIDDRAAQLAAFALMMKARADDRRIFDSEAKPNVVALQDSQGMNAADLTLALNAPVNKEDVPTEYLFEEIQEEKDGLFSKKALAEKGHVSQGDIASLLALFENGKTFGSLIQLPPKLAAKLPEIEKRLNDVLKFGDLTHATARVLKPLLEQARLLGRQYDAVVANPPYMGNRGMNPVLKGFATDQFPRSKSDLFAMFIERGCAFAAVPGRLGFITMHSWMFLSSFEDLRQRIVQTTSIETLAHLGPRAFSTISGEVVQTVAFTTFTKGIGSLRPNCFGLTSGDEDEKRANLLERRKRHSHMAMEDFAAVQGSPLAYWMSDAMRQAFRLGKPLAEIAVPRVGLQTGDNNRFLRLWQEVAIEKIGFGAESSDEARRTNRKWFPYNKGGGHRKWYGNNEYVVNWKDDGSEIKSFTPRSVIRNPGFYFKPSITWSDITTSTFAARLCPKGFLFDVKDSSGFPSDTLRLALLALLCSRLLEKFMKILNPTTTFQVGDLSRVPGFFDRLDLSELDPLVERAVELAKSDWDSEETSWDFARHPLISRSVTVQAAFAGWEADCGQHVRELMGLEQTSNRLFIDAYGLQGELSPEVPDEQITLYRPDQEEDIKRLLSYALGCMMERYSLDKPGLIYAHSGNQDFDPSQYKTFRADDDGIIPLLETDWGIRDDATNRFVEFVDVVWLGNLTTDSTDNTDKKEKGKSVSSLSVLSVSSVVKSSPLLEENLKFVADSLGPNNGEQPRDTIRRYLATGFYRHHLSMYKKRPIYWLFSSGKQRAFQCLVYLHRYHEGTLARMRTEYVIPLQGQIAGRIEQLEGDKTKATSTSHRKKLQKEQDDLKKQEAELRTFEEKLKHAADQKISLDRDDGVKVNYAKFGDLLAESKAICGSKDEE